MAVNGAGLPGRASVCRQLGIDSLRRIVAAVGQPAARELLDALTGPDADRTALIGRLSIRADGEWLAVIGVHPFDETQPERDTPRSASQERDHTPHEGGER